MQQCDGPHAGDTSFEDHADNAAHQVVGDIQIDLALRWQHAGMHGGRPGRIKLLHLVENLGALVRITAEQPCGATGDLISDLRIGPALIVHQNDFGRHAQVERPIDGMDGYWSTRCFASLRQSE